MKNSLINASYDTGADDFPQMKLRQKSRGYVLNFCTSDPFVDQNEKGERYLMTLRGVCSLGIIWVKLMGTGPKRERGGVIQTITIILRNKET
jgi:hypothetical protein